MRKRFNSTLIQSEIQSTVASILEKKKNTYLHILILLLFFTKKKKQKEKKKSNFGPLVVAIKVSVGGYIVGTE